MKILYSLNSSTIATGSNNGWLVPDAVDTVICAPVMGGETTQNM